MNEMIENYLKDLVSGFLYYDRKEDEDLPVGRIEEMVKSGEINLTEMVYVFERELKEALE